MAPRERMKRIEIRREILRDVQRLAGDAGADNLTGYVNDVLDAEVKRNARSKRGNRECYKYDERKTGQDCAAYWGPDPDWCPSCLCFYELLVVPKALSKADAERLAAGGGTDVLALRRTS